MSYEDWKKTTHYSLARLAELDAARERCDNVRPYCEEFCKLDGHQKRETYLEFKPPRGINSRSDEFKQWAGPFIKQIEEIVYHYPAFVKHIPVKDRAKYIVDLVGRLSGPYLVSDFSQFESQFVEMVQHSLEGVLYTYMLGDNPEGLIYASVLQGKNVIRYKDFTVTVKAVRMSGEMSTSLGNGFTNLMLWDFICNKIGTGCTGVVEGDDGLFAVHDPQNRPTPEHFAKLGFRIKLEEHHDLLKASFCGVVMSQDLSSMTDPRKVVLNLGWSHSPSAGPSLRVHRELLLAKSLSLLYEHPRCPILSVMAHTIVTKLRKMKVKPRWESNWYEKQLSTEVVAFEGWAFEEHAKGISDTTRIEFAELYGIDVIQQLKCEYEFKREYHVGMELLPPCFEELFNDGYDDCRLYREKYVFRYGDGFDLSGSDFNIVLTRTENIRDGVSGEPEGWTKTVEVFLNISVLNKMPRDCTAPNRLTCTVPASCFGYPIPNMSKNILEKLVKSSKISTDGAEWLTLALDPFHDYQHQIAGYPDADGSATVVQCFQYAYDLVKPAGSAGNWDAHIFTHPYMSLNTLRAMRQTSADEGAAGAAVLDVGTNFGINGLVNSISADSGQLLYPTYGAAFNPTNGAYAAYGVSQDILQQNSRVIGFGFEVVNTTAEVNKQGAVTCYRLPQMNEYKFINYTDSTQAYEGGIPTKTYRLLPSSAAIAAKLSGSVQWAASEGAYMVVPMSTIENPITGLTSFEHLHSLGTYMSNGDYCLGTAFANGFVAAKATGASVFSPARCKDIPFNSCGAIFTGLSNSSSLRIKIKVYMEVAPIPLTGAGDSALAVLATPSAAYDFSALKMYSTVINHIPVAVPVSMNGFGDFWKDVCGIMSKVAVPALTAIGGAFGSPQLGAAAGQLGQGVWNAWADPVAFIENMGNDRPKMPAAPTSKYRDDGTAVRVSRPVVSRVPAAGESGKTRKTRPMRRRQKVVVK